MLGTTPRENEPSAAVVHSAETSVKLTPSAELCTTAADGSFSLGVVPSTRTIYRIRSCPSVGVAGVVGPAVWALPCASVGTPRAVKTKSQRRRYTVSGTLGPHHASGTTPVRVYVWRWEKGRWKSYGYQGARVTNRSTYSKYATALSLRKTGRYRIRTYHADAGHAASWSSTYAYVRVR